MWSSPAVRRVVASTLSPSLATLGLAARGATYTSAPAGRCLAARTTSSRFSSSKASSSKGEPKNVGASVAAAVEQKSRAGEKKKRRARLPKSAVNKDIPSVPSTGHLSADTVALTSFFSLHRPISVASGYSLPSVVTQESFASIFNSKSTSKSSEVLGVLSGTVEHLEDAMKPKAVTPANDLLVNSSSLDRLQQPNTNTLLMSGDEWSYEAISDSITAMSGRFSPYLPPPLPQERPADGTISTDEAEFKPRVEQFNTVITVSHTLSPDGSYVMVTHGPELLCENEEDEILGRGRTRRVYTISVKRIRKLKMKKKKYKKLMKRTRNERRKLDKL